MARILVCGGYGTFGKRAAERLGRDDCEIIIAGRSPTQALEVVKTLAPYSRARMIAAVVDAARPDPAQFRALAPSVVYNASGPFQSQSDYALARAAIACGAHYVDLADARAFVAGIGALDADARAAGVTVIAGASSVPGLSSAVIDHLKPSFREITRLTYGILPANGFDPGIATTASILSYVGRPFETLRDGKTATVYGWQGLWRYDVPGLGTRLLGDCDIPDLALFPGHYPTLRHIHFSAGMEVPLMHMGLWGLSWLARLRLLPHPERLAGPLLAFKRRMHRFGSDRGGMFVTLDGIGHDGHPKQVCWSMVAHNNQGPYIPQVPATLLARDLASGRFTRRGAFPCVGLITLTAFEHDVADLAIETAVR